MRHKLRPMLAAHLKNRQRSGAGLKFQKTGVTARGASQNSEPLSAPLHSFTAINFHYFTLINVRSIYAPAYLRNRWQRSRGL